MVCEEWALPRSVHMALVAPPPTYETLIHLAPKKTSLGNHIHVMVAKSFHELERVLQVQLCHHIGSAN